MAEASLTIVSPHTDFAQTLAEQVKIELGLACDVASDFTNVGTPLLVVTTEDAPDLGCGVIVVSNKPAQMAALLLEIAQARLQPGDDVAIGGGFVLKLRVKQLHKLAQFTELTDKEVSIIQCLIAAGGEGLTREQLLKNVWGFDSSLDTHTLETHIYRLRNKIRELAGEEAFG